MRVLGVVRDLPAEVWQAGLDATAEIERRAAKAARPSRRVCRHETLERLLSVLSAKDDGGVVTANLLVERCKACGRCKEMPPPI